jgi:hypothetical protein
VQEIEQSLETHIAEDGFAIVEKVLTPLQVDSLIFSLEKVDNSEGVRSRGGVFALRNLLDASPKVRALASSQEIRNLVEPILGPNSFPVRGILFDKIPEANWKVPWHQDVTIAVQQRADVDEFGPWSMKAGVLHVQPPARILENMLSVRIHLDNCSETNGALKVIPGSHSKGKLPDEKVQALRESKLSYTCVVNAGGVLLMRPLLLHASSSSEEPAHRRVIHIDYAASALPTGLEWFSESQKAILSPLKNRISSC